MDVTDPTDSDGPHKISIGQGAFRDAQNRKPRPFISRIRCVPSLSEKSQAVLDAFYRLPLIQQWEVNREINHELDLEYYARHDLRLKRHQDAALTLEAWFCALLDGRIEIEDIAKGLGLRKKYIVNYKQTILAVTQILEKKRRVEQWTANSHLQRLLNIEDRKE